MPSVAIEIGSRAMKPVEREGHRAGGRQDPPVRREHARSLGRGSDREHGWQDRPHVWPLVGRAVRRAAPRLLRRAREAARTWSRSWRTSPAVAASRVSGSRRSASTTSDLGGRSPINDQCRDLIRGDRGGLRRARHRPPGLLGQPQLGPLPGRHPRRDARGRRTPGGRFVTSAYASYSGCRQYRENLYDAVELTAAGAAARQAAALLQPPRFRRRLRRHDAARRSSELPESQRDQAPARLRHALDPDRDGRRRPVPTAGPTSRSTAQSPRLVADAVARGDRASTGRGTLVYCSRSGPAAGPVARARRQRPPRAACRRRGTGGRRRPDRLRLRPHGGRLRPRHRGAPRPPTGSAWRSPGPRRRASIPSFVAVVRDLLVERAAAERGEQVRPGGGRRAAGDVGRLRGDLLPQPARRAPGALRAVGAPVSVPACLADDATTARPARPRGRRRHEPRASWSSRAGAGRSRSPRPSPARPTW